MGSAVTLLPTRSGGNRFSAPDFRYLVLRRQNQPTSLGFVTVPPRPFVIPDDPADRLWRRRTASRVIIVDRDDRILLFRDTDPGYPDQHWWVTPGGGIDPGETEQQAAVREVAEETGLVIAESQLSAPIAYRMVQHGYSDQVLEQRETFFLIRVDHFIPDVSAFTEEEKVTIAGHRWWTPDELTDSAASEWIWPRTLLELVAHAGRQAVEPLDLGLVTDESTRPV